MNNENQPASPHKKNGKLMLITAWIIALILLTKIFKPIEEARYNPNTSPSSSSKNGSKQVFLKRNRQGHYVTSGSINGKKVVFLIDTGASEVSIPQQLANKLGLKAGVSQPRSTANGTIKVYMTRLNELSVGELSFSDIRASINPHMKGETILLGMSALKTIEFHQRGDVLTLTTY